MADDATHDRLRDNQSCVRVQLGFVENHKRSNTIFAVQKIITGGWLIRCRKRRRVGDVPRLCLILLDVLGQAAP